MRRFLKRIYYRLKSNYTTEDLIDRGLVVGSNFKRMHDTIIDPSHCWLINIGDNVTLAPRVHILAHDASTKLFLDYTRIGSVRIGNNVFVGADTVILPGVNIGSNVVIGANSTVSKDVSDNSVYAGSPAKFIEDINSFIEKNKVRMQNSKIYNQTYTINGGIDKLKKEQMRDELENQCGFIE